MSKDCGPYDRVPTEVLVKRLEQLSRAASEARFNEFTMRVPAEPNRDADLVLASAAMRLRELTWQPMETAPRDGSTVLALLDGSDIPHPIRWLSAGCVWKKSIDGWYMTWDLTPIAPHDGPRYWMPIPNDPDK